MHQHLPPQEPLSPLELTRFEGTLPRVRSPWHTPTCSLLTKIENACRHDYSPTVELYRKWLSGDRFEMCHHGVPHPTPAAHVVAAEVHGMERQKILDEQAWLGHIDDARHWLSVLFGARDKREVAICRTVTEAAGLLLELCPRIEHSSDPSISPYSGSVLILDITNPSIERTFAIYPDDCANEQQKSKSSTYQCFPTYRSRVNYGEIRPSGLDIVKLQVYGKNIDQIRSDLTTLMAGLKAPLSMAFVDHVCKYTFRILPLADICDLIQRGHKKRFGCETFIAVDGAFALGILPKVDVNSYACHAYLASTNKAAPGTVAGGMWLDLKTPGLLNKMQRLPKLDPTERTILRGMFDYEWRIASNDNNARIDAADLAGFVTAMRGLKSKYKIDSNNLHSIYADREHSYQEFINLLNRFSDTHSLKIETPQWTLPSAHIGLSFRFPELMLRTRDKGAPVLSWPGEHIRREPWNRRHPVGWHIAHSLSQAGALSAYFGRPNLLRLGVTLGRRNDMLEIIESAFEKMLVMIKKSSAWPFES